MFKEQFCEIYEGIATFLSNWSLQKLHMYASLTGYLCHSYNTNTRRRLNKVQLNRVVIEVKICALWKLPCFSTERNQLQPGKEI